MTLTSLGLRSSSVFGFRTLHAPVLGVLVLSLAGCGVTENGPTEDRSQPVVPQIIRQPLITGAETCAAATLSTESFADPVDISDTTVGATDDYDLPDAMNPTCTAAPACLGTGNGGSPRGTVWQGSGTGPDRAFRFQVSSAITLNAVMTSPADLGLYLFSSACTNELSACACISDNAFGGMPEIISEIQAVPGVDYYLVVDGYLDPMVGTPSSGAFDLTISETVPPVCGNNSTDVGEACDDGNTENCDGCRADCLAQETGCGDGFTCGGEACDDHNTTNGDGCSASCLVEGVEPLPDGGSPTPDSDGGTLPNAGAGGTTGGGEGDGGSSSGGSNTGNGGSMSGGNIDADGSVTASGGQTGSNNGKGQVKGGGGTAAGGATSSSTTNERGDSGGGCAVSSHASSANTAWLSMLGLIVLHNAARGRARRRARA